MPYKLLEKFEALFLEGAYRHRVSTHGDAVAVRFFEDLYNLRRSQAYVSRVDDGLSVLNAQNRRHGVKARRGDGTFGEIVPNVQPAREDGFVVQRAPIATIEIGIEVKILAKAMIKQIDRVINDLTGQARHFRSKRGRPITVGIVGVNQAQQYLSYEGEKTFPTDGRKYRHPIQEAAEAEARLRTHAAPDFDEFLVLRFVATNLEPYNFQWTDRRAAEMDYGAILARVSQRYQADHGGGRAPALP